MAQVPVPVPISRIRPILSCNGAKKCLPSIAVRNTSCIISYRSCSPSSLGKLYAVDCASVLLLLELRFGQGLTPFSETVIPPAMLPVVTRGTVAQRAGITCPRMTSVGFRNSDGMHWAFPMGAYNSSPP